MAGALQLKRWRAATVAMILAVAPLSLMPMSASPAAAAESSDLEHLCALNDYTPTILPQFTALGGDGNVWFTDLVGIGRVTPAGVMTVFSAGVPLGTVITRIVAGPDGALWYLMPVSPAAVGRITTDGVATVFSAGIPGSSKPVDIAAGPDGNLWITAENTKTIYRMTPTGTVTPFAIPEPYKPGAITAGSDGNLWFGTATAAIGRMTPAGDVTMFTDGLPSDTVVQDLTLGPDGEVWFADVRGRVGHISAAGDVTVIQVPPRTVDLPDDTSQEVRDQVEFLLNNPAGGPTEITPADDGSLWFSERLGGRIGKVTTGGLVTFVDLQDLPVPEDIFPEAVMEALDEVPLAQQRVMAGYVWQLGGLSVGSDGNLWLRTGASTAVPTAAISRMTPDGRITSSPGSAYQTIGSDEVVGPDGRLWYLAGGFGVGYVEPDGHSAVYLVTGARTSSTPGSLTFGPDGNIWFTEIDRDRIVRMTPSGVVTRFTTGITAGAGPSDITTGPDGNLWFTEIGLKRIGRITPGGEVTEFAAGITGVPGRIVGGGGGNLWFTEIDPSTGTHVRLARVTTAGVVTELPVEANARITDLTSDGDGNVWVIGDTVGAGGMSTAGWIDRITPDGTITRTEIDSDFDLELTKSIAAVDGDLWFSMEAIDVVDGTLDPSTYDALGSLWRMTPDGTVTRFDTSPVHPLGIPNEGLFPPIQHVIGGPDGALWFNRFTALPNLYRGTVPDHVGDPCDHDDGGDPPSISNLPTSARVGDQFTATVVTSGDGTTSVTSSTTGVCTVSNLSVSFIAAGTCTLTAHVGAGATHPAADGSAQSVTVTAAPDGGGGGGSTQSIVFVPPAGGVVGETVTLTATGGASGKPVVFSVDPSSTPGTCTIAGNKLTYTGAGSCVINADQAGDSTHSAAPRVQRTVVVIIKALPVINPTIAAVVSDGGQKAHGGWYAHAVTITFTCAIGSAPLTAPCPAPIVLHRSGRNLGATATITATDGGTASVSVSGIKLDLGKPHVRVTGAKNGHSYPHNRNLRCRATDALSGIARCTITRRSHADDGIRYVRWTAIATDKAGNVRVLHGHYRVQRTSN